MMGGCRLDTSGIGWRQVLGSYEHGNGPPGPITCEKFLD
jgi:hypothetical protein